MAEHKVNRRETFSWPFRFLNVLVFCAIVVDITLYTAVGEFAALARRTVCC
jgi:hypothetical protein